jgi:hypothetical protein
MNDQRNSRDIAGARARRRAAGLVAQYIHELSQRHATRRRRDGESNAQTAPEAREALT